MRAPCSDLEFRAFGEIARKGGLVKALNLKSGASLSRKKLDDLSTADRTAVVWGGGSKGVTFLNIMKAGNEVTFVVDINPHKQGKFIAGSGQQIVAPEALVADPPAVIIVMNPLYRDEIAAMVNSLGIASDIVGV